MPSSLVSTDEAKGLGVCRREREARPLLAGQGGRMRWKSRARDRAGDAAVAPTANAMLNSRDRHTGGDLVLGKDFNFRHGG
jgi:hypothetical protein